MRLSRMRRWVEGRSVSLDASAAATGNHSQPQLLHLQNSSSLAAAAANSAPSIPAIVDTRTHVIRELFDTEASYVESLHLMVNKYLRPLKRPELCSLVEPGLVDEMFFQVPEILAHHEFLFAALKARLESRDAAAPIGDILLNNFTKQSVIDTYTSFINNWKNAKRAMRIACQTKPAFAKYLVRCSREHRNKLTLDALLIMPVQRIPRYELLIKELLKHTPLDHPDSPLLLAAARELHDLATKIDTVEQEAGISEQMQQRLREIEAIVQGLDDLVSEERVFFRYDVVGVETEGGRKDRCVFLFSDQLLITSLKRKAGPALKRTPRDLYPVGHNFLENHKFKLLMKISLDDLEIKGSDSHPLKSIQRDIQQLQEDIRVLGKMTDLADLLKLSHPKLDKEIENLKDDGRSKLGEKSLELTTNPALTSLRLFVTTEEGVEGLEARFGSAEKRESWEKAFLEAKEALGLAHSRRPPPAFLKALALPRGRAGLHLLAAAVAQPPTPSAAPSLWLSHSDAEMGQVGLLELGGLEPNLVPPTALANSAILALCPVPTPRYMPRKRKTSSTLQIPVDAAETLSNLALESDSSDDETPTMPPAEDPDPLMWIGTEDGSIMVLSLFESNKSSRHCLQRAQHSSSVASLVYADDKVFAALGSGCLIYYDRRKNGGWDLASHTAVDCGSASGRVGLLANVGQRIWAAADNLVLVLNPSTITFERSFPVNSDPDAGISCMATGGLGVWIALSGSPVLKLYHSLTFSALLDLNVCPAVTKALAGSDDIIRQHKLSKLRVSGLLCARDTLFVGTSAGVLLSLQLPHLSHSTTRHLTAQPPLSVLPLGHVGQCRWLAAVDPSSGLLSRTSSHTGSFSGISELGKRRMSLNVAALQQGRVYVISGGEGFEDAQSGAADDEDESVGRNDSTSHLLIWQI